MQKKLLAVAVAGALAVPVVAAAQSSVTISGRVTYEYGSADQGNGRENVDYSDTPGGSSLRFAGQESLGGGLTAWFQCETSLDIRGVDQVGFCSRNSAVGLRGGFGNVFFGRWDTPFKRVMNHGTVGAEETGILGTSFLGFGGSGGSSHNPSAAQETLQRQRWKRRETSLMTYETPNFGGFQAIVGVTSANEPADAPFVVGQANSKPRVWSLGGQYVAGPLAIGAGYEEHKEFGPSNAIGGESLDDKGYGVGISYGFLNGTVLVGANWLRREWETGGGTETKKDTWGIGVDWRLPGPHQLQFQYQQARDTKGNGASIGGNGGANGCGATILGTVGCNDTGADQFSVAYQYHLSKRTTVKVAYTKVDNDSRSNAVRIGNTAALLGFGENVDSYGFLVKHNF